MTGQGIRNLRLSLGLSQQAFAEKLGVSVGSVHRWETGKNTPHPVFLEKMQELAKQAVSV